MQKPSCSKPRCFAVLAFLMVFSVVAGCSSNEMSRSKAKELLTSHGQYPKEITSHLRLGEFRSGSSSAKQYMKFVKELNQSGLGKGSHNDIPFLHQMVFNISLNDTAKKYVRDEVAMIHENRRYTDAEIVTHIGSFVEITGIVSNQDSNFASVEYTEIYEPTPFASFDFLGKEKGVITREKKQVFKLYDDGWRKTKWGM